jgi:hypothetical protein
VNADKAYMLRSGQIAYEQDLVETVDLIDLGRTCWSLLVPDDVFNKYGELDRRALYHTTRLADLGWHNYVHQGITLLPWSGFDIYGRKP